MRRRSVVDLIRIEPAERAPRDSNPDLEIRNLALYPAELGAQLDTDYSSGSLTSPASWRSAGRIQPPANGQHSRHPLALIFVFTTLIFGAFLWLLGFFADVVLLAGETPECADNDSCTGFGAVLHEAGEGPAVS
jgi:hypothetical protein